MPVAIVGLIASAGVTGLTTAAGGLTLLGSVLAGAIGLGIQFGINLLFAPKAQKPEAVKGVVRQSTPVRSKHRGLVRVGGKLAFIGVRKGILYQVIYLGQGPINRFVEHRLDDRVFVVPPGGGQVAAGEPFDSTLSAWFRLGQPDQTAFEKMVEVWAAKWSVEHRLRGCALALVATRRGSIKTFSERYPNRISQYNAVFEGALDYDPRTGTTAYTANLAIHLRGYLTDADGAQIDPAYIDDAEFSAAANLCDDLLVSKGGGTVRRYHGSFSYELDSEPGGNIGRLVQATLGRLYLKPSGKIGFKVGVWEEPTVHIMDKHIRGHELRDRSGPLRECNEVRVKYINPNARFSEADAQPWRNEQDISESGRVKPKPIEAYEINNHNHARRLAKYVEARANPRWSGTISTNLYGMKAWDQRFIRVTIAELAIFGQTFEVMQIGYNDESASVMMQIASLSAEALAFNAELEEGTAPVDPAEVEPDAVETPQNIQAVVTPRPIGGGNNIAVVKLSWDEPEDDSLEPEVDQSIADAEDWKRVLVDKDERTVEIIGLQDGLLYDFRVRFRDPGGKVGNYGLLQNVLVVADTTVPPVPTDPSADVNGATVELGVRAGVTPENTRYLKFMRRTTGAPPSSAVLRARIPATPASDRYYDDTPGPGSWTYDFIADNGSGLLSAAVSLSVVVT